jgi:hypothetical protein
MISTFIVRPTRYGLARANALRDAHERAIRVATHRADNHAPNMRAAIRRAGATFAAWSRVS